MKEFRFRIILIAGAIALCIYLLYPTYADYQNSKQIAKSLAVIKDSVLAHKPNITQDELESILRFKEDSIRVSNPSFKSASEKRIKLGLDLQGGMYLVMEVNTGKLLERLAKNPDDTFTKIITEAEKEARVNDEDVVSIFAKKMEARNIRLSRYFGSIRDDNAKILSELQKQESDAVSRAIEIIRNRVDQYGVSEPSIQKQGTRRIIIELPGIAKEEEAKKLLQGRALLEFKLVKDASFAFPIMTKIDEVLAQSLSGDSTISDTAKEDTTSVKNMTEAEYAKKHPFFAIARILDPSGRREDAADAYVAETDKNLLNNYLSRPEVQKVIPDNVQFLFDAKPVTEPDGKKFYRMYMVNKQPELTGGVIVDAQANIDPNTTAPIVTMQMNGDGAREWARITGSNVGKRCAVVLDGVVYTAPVIQNKIPNGNSQISGSKDMDEAKLLEIVLKAGALPAPIDIIEERTVGPSLGQDSISQGFNSALIGFIIVAVFMIFYYKKAGSVADFGLFVTILMLLGILAGFRATLTLPGIAGIILTMGMAVDANVLIYERIREELATGKTIKASVESGFANSFSAIFDSNITTFFTGLILYQFGSGPVQGFALTLMIGIATSLFSALVVTRLVFDFMVAKGYSINVG